MFENNVFDEWLDKRTQVIISNMGAGKVISSEDMILLVLKAQTNHFNHLDVELRQDMKDLREDMAHDMKSLREDMARDMKSLREDMARDMKDLRDDMTRDMKILRDDMDKRFEQVDKRFEQVDKRFEQVDKRFDLLISRIDRFMIWSFAITLSVGGMVVAAIKFL